MDSGKIHSIRALPRIAWQGELPPLEFFDIPADKLVKLRNVLRLGTGDKVCVLMGNGEVWLCEIEGKTLVLSQKFSLERKRKRWVRLIQALPKAESLDEILRMCTELGVDEFVLFGSERSVVKWDEKKWNEKLRRLRAIRNESCEVSFRAEFPEIYVATRLKACLEKYPESIVLSEYETVGADFHERVSGSKVEVTLIVGPEGGWTRNEHELIGERAVTMGNLVFRVDTAAVAASAIACLAN